MTLATFGTFFAISDELLTGERTLFALLPFNILQFVLDMFPNLISNIVQASVSLRRLRRFLQIDEIDPDNKETSGMCYSDFIINDIIVT